MDAAADILSKQLAAETQKRQRAETLCVQTLFQKATELAVEREARKTSEDLSASLQEQVNRMSQKLDELVDEKEKRKSTEELCATLKGQLATMIQATRELDDERKLRKAAEDHVAVLQDVLETMTIEKDELKTQLQHKSGSGFSHGVTWQYETDGRWEAFPPEANEQMHQAYLHYLSQVPGSRSTIISSGGVDREVDFDHLQQRHLRTGKTRRIRVSAGVPRQWVTPPQDLLQQGNDLRSFYKEEADPGIWEAIRRILRDSGQSQAAWSDCSCMRGAEVKSVHRIENMRLWHRYRMRLDAVRRDHDTYKISVEPAALDLDGLLPCMAESQQTLDCGETLALDVDEKILLHGTSYDNADAIVREGFDHRTCQNGLYGLGVYFACAACKSHQYTCEHFKGPQTQLKLNHECERTLIIARVALGDSYVATGTRKNDRRPPLRSDSSLGTYDSIVVRPGLINGHPSQNQIHQEYVIFDREQAYPCFVVQYTVWTLIWTVVSKNVRQNAASAPEQCYSATLDPTSHFVQWHATNQVSIFLLNPNCSIYESWKLSVFLNKKKSSASLMTDVWFVHHLPVSKVVSWRVKSRVSKLAMELMDGTVVTAVTDGAGGITFWVELVKKKTDGIDMFYSFWMKKTV